MQKQPVLIRSISNSQLPLAILQNTRPLAEVVLSISGDSCVGDMTVMWSKRSFAPRLPVSPICAPAGLHRVLSHC